MAAHIQDQCIFPFLLHLYRNEIDTGVPNEISGESVGRLIVYGERRCKLLKFPLLHEGNFCCQRHSFQLVMGHVDESGIRIQMEALQL